MGRQLMTWEKAYRFTECCALGAVFMGLVVFDDHRLSIALIASGVLTYFVARTVK